MLGYGDDNASLGWRELYRIINKINKDLSQPEWVRGYYVRHIPFNQFYKSYRLDIRLHAHQRKDIF